MVETLKENWFVVVIAIIMIAAIGYFIFDSNKYNVSSRSSDGKEVLASITDKDITADDVYKESSMFDANLLYNMYRNAVVEQTIKTTDAMKDEAKELENTIRANASSQENYESAIGQELASYGFNGFDELYDYCLMTVKEKEMNRIYINDHFDALSESVKTKNPRTISILSMNVVDPSQLNETEQKKKDSIDESINKDGFAKTATAFSEDTNTASNKGLYGYIDSDSTANQNSPLDASVIDAALALNKDETSDWIQVQDRNSGQFFLYKVHVNETDITKMNKSKNKDVKDQLLYAFLNANQGLSTTILEDNATKLDVKFNDKKVEEKLQNYIKQQKGEQK